MEDRRPFLDLEMYKISEEDSQDEEVSGGGEVERKGEAAEEAEEEKRDGSRLFKLVLEEEDENGTGSSSANYDNLLGREDEIMEEDLNEVPLSKLCNQIPEHLFDAVAILFTTSVKLNKKTGRTGASRSKRDSGKSGGPAAREQRSGIDRIKESEVDVVFSWPKKTKSKTVQGLVASQGMFVTLFKALKDVTGAHPIASQVDMDGQLTNISYASDNEGKSLLLVAVAETLPGKEKSAGGLSEGCVTRFTSRLTEAILFKWASLTRAFLTANEKEMGRFLANAMTALLNGHPDDFLLFNQPRAFPVVPNNVMVKVEQILLDFESSDFSEEFRKAPRGHAEGCNDGNNDFHCLGSILLYKEEMVSSHLEAKIQSSLYTWMMTDLNKWGRSAEWPKVKKMAIWQPAFLKGRNFDGKDEKALSRSCHYVVLVGLDYFLLGFVLEPIASPCDKFFPPDVRWIRKGLGALIQLVRSDVYSFFSSDVPEPVEMVQHSNSTTKSTPITRLKGKGGANKEEKVGNLKSSSGGGMSSRAAGALEDGKSLATPRPSANIQSLIDEFEASHIEGKRTPEKYEPAGSDSGPYVGGSDASSSRLSGDGSDTASIDRSSNYFDSVHDSVNPVSITKGNLLYQFVHLNSGLGVMVSPRSQPVQEEANLQEEITKNFRKAALATHELLQRAAIAKETLAKEEKDWKWASKTLSKLVESGTLFELNISDGVGPRKKKKKICYWVVGRLCENGQEIYVCMKDSVEQQSCLETAFKIAQVMHAG